MKCSCANANTQSQASFGNLKDQNLVIYLGKMCTKMLIRPGHTAELATFALSYWHSATFHQSFIFHHFFSQVLSPKDGDTEMEKAEDR